MHLITVIVPTNTRRISIQSRVIENVRQRWLRYKRRQNYYEVFVPFRKTSLRGANCSSVVSVFTNNNNLTSILRSFVAQRVALLSLLVRSRANKEALCFLRTVINANRHVSQLPTDSRKRYDEQLLLVGVFNDLQKSKTQTHQQLLQNEPAPLLLKSC